MYNVSYINTIRQFDHIYTTVLIQDQNQIYPDIRIDKQYDLDVSKNDLIEDCINDIYTYNSDIIDYTNLNMDYSGIDN
jgi:hypothetical protein